jgi:hypothetical protein
MAARLYPVPFVYSSWRKAGNSSTRPFGVRSSNPLDHLPNLVGVSHLLLGEREAEVEREVAPGRGDPGEAPFLAGSDPVLGHVRASSFGS